MQIKKISQEEFEEMLEDWFDMLEIKYDNVKSAFKRLHDVAGFNNLIDLEKYVAYFLETRHR